MHKKVKLDLISYVVCIAVFVTPLLFLAGVRLTAFGVALMLFAAFDFGNTRFTSGISAAIFYIFLLIAGMFCICIERFGSVITGP